MRRIWLGVVAACLYVFMYAPIVVVIVFSFNAARHGGPWAGFTTEWYAKLLASEEKQSAAWNTLVLACVSTGIATGLGTMLGYGLSRYQFPGKRQFSLLMYIPVVIPDIVMAVAMLSFYVLIRDWLGLFEFGMTTMVIAHITFQIPFVAIVVRSRLAGMDPAIEEAAHDLGASTWQTFWNVTLPLMLPGVLAGAMLAFTLSLDDFVVSFFTTGPGATTLPILIYSSVKRGITPDINALSTLIVLASVFGTIGVTLLQRKRLVAIAVGLLVAASASAATNKLNVFIWSEYIDPKIIEQFAKEYDCKVTVDLYEDNEAMMSKLQGGGVSLYDVCVPSDYVVPALIKNKLIAPLRHENIPNIKNIDPQFANREFDPGNQYTVPYQWGTYGIYIRKQKDETVDQTWGLIFDPRKQAGPFVLIDSMRECIGAALKFKGYSMNSTNRKELKEARDLVLNAKKRSLGFEVSIGCRNKVLAKGCRLAMVYNGDAVQGMKQDPDTYYFVPREGGEIWQDNLAVLAQAPHRDMAEKFLNYILDAKIGAQLSNFNPYATPNKAARPFINPDDLKNPAIYPPPEIMARLEFLKDLGPKAPWYDELWTAIKSK